MNTTAKDIEAALAKKFAAPEYAFLLQVRNGTGFQRTTRTADALAFSLYPSRGLTITGFEIKVSKFDWARELKDPDKAEDIARHCNTWHIVAPKGVVPVEEVPAAWGLMELGENGKLKSAKYPEIRKPEPLPPLMIASIMRNIETSMMPRSMIKPAIEAARQQALDEAKRSKEYSDFEYQRLRKSVADFEEASGVSILYYRGGDIGEAVKQVMRLKSDPGDYLRDLEYIRNNVHRLDTELEAAIEQIGQVVKHAQPA